MLVLTEVPPALSDSIHNLPSFVKLSLVISFGTIARKCRVSFPVSASQIFTDVPDAVKNDDEDSLNPAPTTVACTNVNTQERVLNQQQNECVDRAYCISKFWIVFAFGL